MPSEPTTLTPLRGRLLVLGLDALGDPVDDVLGGERTRAYGGEHVVRGRVVRGARHVLQDPGGNLPDAPLLEVGDDLLAAEAQVVLAVGLVEELPDLVTRPAALHDGQPVPAGARGLAGDDLHPVARDQLRVEGHDAAVHLRPDGAVPDLGVDVVGEVYRGRP
jgi:hypothetical protein